MQPGPIAVEDIPIFVYQRNVRAVLTLRAYDHSRNINYSVKGQKLWISRIFELFLRVQCPKIPLQLFCYMLEWDLKGFSRLQLAIRWQAFAYGRCLVSPEEPSFAAIC
jgi:hypothetical protein